MPENALASALSAEVDLWFNDTFHNHGPALSDALFHHFQEAKESLKARLTSLVEKEG